MSLIFILGSVLFYPLACIVLELLFQGLGYIIDRISYLEDKSW